MATKTQIIETLGEGGLLLPDLIAEGLAANDRVKYYLTLLQTATAHAGQPLGALPDLRSARESSGVTDVSLDDLAAASRYVTEGIVFVPGAERVRTLLFDDVRRMLEPLAAVAGEEPDQHERYETFRARFDRHLEASGTWADDQFEAVAIDGLTGFGDEDHDTLHRLVMDLHRELNRLLASVAVDTIDGAQTSGLEPGDRPLVAAFMKGLHETSPLKFDHPGLGTTAARYAGRLAIQNDLGTTDAHVVVVRIVGTDATVVYADVHRRRALFLQELLRSYPIEWQGGLAMNADQQLLTGTFRATDPAHLEGFLQYFGSRLVFLIDWNRARKQLARVIGKADAVAVLKWAADHDVGHRGFLQAGGVRVINTALARIAPAQLRHGVRLDEWIGRSAAQRFTRAVLSQCAGGLSAGHSQHLIEDAVQAELLARLPSSERRLLDTAADHALLVSALAERLRRVIADADTSQAADARARTARLARTWEARADGIVRDALRARDGSDGNVPLHHLLGQADEVADALEETAFLLTLVPEGSSPDHVAGVQLLADLVGDEVKEYVRALEYAKDLSGAHGRADLDEVLVRIDRVGSLEHAADIAEREARAQLLRVCGDFRELHVLLDVVRTFEDAADAVGRCAVDLREYALASGAVRP